MLEFINLPDDYKVGAERIINQLGLYMDVNIRFYEAEGLETGFKNGEGYIACCKKNHFYRLLVLFVQYFKGREFCINEKENFETLSLMLDLSRNAVLTVKSIKEYIVYMAAMGYNQLQMYMEDMYEIKSRPYFGYMRGRYSFDDLKEIDDFGFEMGIEIVPCIQTLGHMEGYLRWEEAQPVGESGSILLADNEETYKFIREMMTVASAPFRSKRIHVGLDETFGLGLGRYLSLNGYVKEEEIYLRHLGHVAEIAKELGLRPMMWTDLLCRLRSKDYMPYSRDIEFPKEFIEKVPQNMEFCYWQYGSFLDAETYMLEKHIETGHNTMFAGGVWIFAGALPDNIFSARGSEQSIKECKRFGIKELMLTVWSYENAVYQTSFLEMQRYAELTYNETSEKISERFEFLTGASYDAFIRMSDFHALYCEGVNDYETIGQSARFRGQKLLWQDIMLGIFDNKLFEEKRSGHYKKMEEIFAGYTDRADKWHYLYEYCRALFALMSEKCFVAETLYPAYKKGDKEALAKLAKTNLPSLYEKISDVYEALSYHKELFLKPFGDENIDIYFGGMLIRCKKSIKRLEAYLDGKIEKLEELEEERLPINDATWGYNTINLSMIHPDAH